MSAKNNKTYVSNGQVLQSPPFSVRLVRFFESVYMALGLYLVTLFTFFPYTVAEESKFNVHRSRNNPSSRWGGSSSSFGGGGGGGGGPRRVGRVHDIRGPECSSCR